MGDSHSGGRLATVGDAIWNKLSPISDDGVGKILVLLGTSILLVDLVRRLIFGELTVVRFSSFLWNGTLDSMYIALAAVGLSMTYSILRFANFSHGDLITTGAFGGWAAAYVVGGWGLASFGDLVLLRASSDAPSPGAAEMDILASPLVVLVGLVFAAVFTVLIALAIDRLVYKRMRESGGIPLLIASVGVALALRHVLSLIFTNDSRGVTASAPSVGPVNAHELTLVCIGLVLIVGLHVLLQYSKLGKSMRAMADNRDLALITGIPTERVIFATWAIGAAFAGVAGYLIVLNRGTLSINLGWFLLLLIFAAVVLGGIGSIYGALLGAFIIGLTMNVSLVWIPASLNQITAFVLMILILIFRPQGLLGGVETA